VDRLHQLELVDRAGHLGGGERWGVLAHRELADPVARIRSIAMRTGWYGFT
jgi:hypothetical protein